MIIGDDTEYSNEDSFADSEDEDDEVDDDDEIENGYTEESQSLLTLLYSIAEDQARKGNMWNKRNKKYKFILICNFFFINI